MLAVDALLGRPPARRSRLSGRQARPSRARRVARDPRERQARGGRADDARGRRTRAGLDMRVLAITLATISHNGYNVLDGALALRQRAMIAMNILMRIPVPPGKSIVGTGPDLYKPYATLQQSTRDKALL